MTKLYVSGPGTLILKKRCKWTGMTEPVVAFKAYEIDADGYVVEHCDYDEGWRYESERDAIEVMTDCGAPRP